MELTIDLNKEPNLDIRKLTEEARGAVSLPETSLIKFFEESKRLTDRIKKIEKDFDKKKREIDEDSFEAFVLRREEKIFEKRKEFFYKCFKANSVALSEYIAGKATQQPVLILPSDENL